MTTKITVEELEAKIREIAAANPDHTYCPIEDAPQTCRYAADVMGDQVGWEHGCIVGQALHALYPHLEHDDEGDLIIDGRQASDSYHWLARNHPDLFPDSMWVGMVQRHQDAGKSWSAAVKRADDALKPQE